MSFNPTPEQEEVMNYLRQQVYEPEGHNVVVSGAGGSGKTSMVCALIVEFLSRNYRVAVTAMTGKATAVLRNKVWQTIKEEQPLFDKANLCIETFSKITKKSTVVGLTESGETIYTNQWKDPKSFGYDVLIVDELSMVPHWLSQWWNSTGCIVFGFGDECQLPEVSTSDTKKELVAFQHDLRLPSMNYVPGYGIKVLKTLAQQKLTKVLRSDNEIAHLCADLRDFKMTKGEIVSCIKGWAAKTPNVQYSTDIQDIETDPDWQILAFKNATCSAINNQLAIGDTYPELSDKIIILDNIGPLQKYNGDTMLFGDFLASIAKYNHPQQKRRIYVCMKFQGKMPRGDSTNPIEKAFFDVYIRFKGAIRDVDARRMKCLENIIRESGYAPGQIEEWVEDVKAIQKQGGTPGEQFQNILERFYQVDRDMAQHIVEKSEPSPRLYIVNADFGYAITTHKSQGSEYPKVCYILEKFDKPLLYTGISRAKEQVKIINLTKER